MSIICLVCGQAALILRKIPAGELENFIERLVVTADKDIISADSLPLQMKKSGEPSGKSDDGDRLIPYKEAKEQFER